MWLRVRAEQLGVHVLSIIRILSPPPPCDLATDLPHVLSPRKETVQSYAKIFTGVFWAKCCCANADWSLNEVLIVALSKVKKTNLALIRIYCNFPGIAVFQERL